MRACAASAVPVLARGGATSLNGQTVNVAVVIDCSKYLDRVLAIDARARSARVEPGVVCDTLRDAAEAHGLTFAPDPATHSRCTLGGMIGNNSCGPHSVMAGTTVDNIERLEVLTYDGERFWCGPTSDVEFRAHRGDRRATRREIYRKLKGIADKYGDAIRKGFPKIKRRVSGYNLDQLLPENGFNVARALVGSEGTCALTLQAEVRLVKSPPERVLVVLGVPGHLRRGRRGAAHPGRKADRLRRPRRGDHRRPARAPPAPGRHRAAAAGQGLADGRVRRRYARRSRAARRGARRRRDHRQGDDRAAVDHPRDRRLGHLAQPRRQGNRSGGRLGGRGGRPAAPRRLPARVPGAGRPLRLPHFAYTGTSATAASTRASTSTCAPAPASSTGATS